MREHDETAAPADLEQRGVRRTPRAQERKAAVGRPAPGSAGVRRPPAEEVPEQRRRGGGRTDPVRAAAPDAAAPGAARAVTVDAEVSDPASAPSPPAAPAPDPSGAAPSGPRGAEGRAKRPGPRGMDPGDVRERWQETQGGFVDDPRGTVREADALAAEVAEAVISGIEARRAALRSAWSEGDGSDTESLRLALRDYRSFVEHLVDAGR
ncbi:hypothetical protein ACIRPH_20185 [Nocardiopsis sp. NPDC101807]|uniref:hypothetical protein n=1 Tax=Nocardiopsis sp. NPDC101807 TaxID=3364339 RepID=UPI0038101B4D